MQIGNAGSSQQLLTALLNSSSEAPAGYQTNERAQTPEGALVIGLVFNVFALVPKVESVAGTFRHADCHVVTMQLCPPNPLLSCPLKV